MSIGLHTQIYARLAEISSPNALEVVHCSGGDSRLPRNLRGQTPDIPRLPSVAEVIAHLDGDTEPASAEIDFAICLAAEALIDTGDPVWTDDLSVHILC